MKIWYNIAVETMMQSDAKYLGGFDRDIGVILCREANRIVVEYAMSRTMSPVMVAQYKRLLIPKEVLERTFEEYLSLPDLSQEKRQ